MSDDRSRSTVAVLMFTSASSAAHIHDLLLDLLLMAEDQRAAFAVIVEAVQVCRRAEDAALTLQGDGYPWGYAEPDGAAQYVALEILRRHPVSWRVVGAILAGSQAERVTRAALASVDGEL